MTRNTLSRRSLLAAALAPASPMAADADRPQYHLLPPANWMNDPNAPIYWKGEYHMFYQYNPKAPYWDTMHWGHAVSRDLVHWKHLPIALRPTPGGPDKDGCFSGCMVVDNGKPVMVYTGVNPEVQCLATTENMVDWSKHPANPVLAARPIDTPGYRDPHVWREGSEWLMALGAGFRNKGGAVLLFSSPDLVKWTYLHPLHTGTLDPAANPKDSVARGEMWECPDFFPVGNKHLLYVATLGKVIYWLGTYQDRRFTPERSGTLVHGPYYAPKSCDGARGQRLIWGWLQERRTRDEQIRAGWSGVMSLPVVPSLSATGELLLDPASEYTMLRRKEYRPETAPAAGIVWPLKGIDPLSCEIEVRFPVNAPGKLGLQRAGQPLVEYDPETERLSLGPITAQHKLPTGEGLHLHLYIDGSVLELFANRRTAMTARLYGASGQFALIGGGKGTTLDVWGLAPISPDRLTS